MSESELLEALCMANLRRNIDDVKAALAAGANPNGHQTHTINLAPMNQAAAMDFVAGLEAMYAAGGSIEGVTGRTPLMTAAVRGQLCAARWLVQHGADLTTKSRDHASHTALEFALETSNLSIATMILEERPDFRGNALNKTAIRVISDPHNEEVAAWLLQAGISPDLCALNNKPWLVHILSFSPWFREPVTKLLLQAGANVHATADQGWTALYQAAKAGFFPEFAMLLRAGSDPDRATADGETVRSYLAAAQRSNVSSTFKQMQELLTIWEASEAAQKIIASHQLSEGIKPI